MTRFGGAHRALLATALLLVLPPGTATAQTANPAHQLDPKAGFSSESRRYPDMNATYAREGHEERIARIRSVQPGMSRLDLQRTLGRPAIGYRDGSLEYHLSLSLTGRDRLICQYRVFFDDDGAVERAAWRRPQCANLIWAR
ncbi:outer membrane protein assembly factor BamE domain-containing protein [Ponticoccus litoralis]|uniref:Outer membrane protein assembly factor BamE domain-containing protein n=1 Tax=Ponticoccus litoralis TaxID=422297 RepID=A0AAW9SNU6_9RHOB